MLPQRSMSEAEKTTYCYVIYEFKVDESFLQAMIQAAFQHIKPKITDIKCVLPAHSQVLNIKLDWPLSTIKTKLQRGIDTVINPVRADIQEEIGKLEKAYKTVTNKVQNNVDVTLNDDENAIFLNNHRFIAELQEQYDKFSQQLNFNYYFNAKSMLTLFMSSQTMDVYVFDAEPSEKTEKFIGYNNSVADQVGTQKNMVEPPKSLEDLQNNLTALIQTILTTKSFVDRRKDLQEYFSLKDVVQKVEVRECREQLLTWRKNAASVSVGERWQVLRDALNAARAT